MLLPLFLLAGLGVAIAIKQMNNGPAKTAGGKSAVLSAHITQLKLESLATAPVLTAAPTGLLGLGQGLATPTGEGGFWGKFGGAAPTGTPEEVASKLDLIDKKAKEAYNKLTAPGKKEGADALNKELGTNLEGDESWEEVKDAIAGPIGATAGGAIGGAFGGPAGAILGAAVGSYLGVKLGDLLSKGYGEIEQFFEDHWGDVEDAARWVKDKITSIGGLQREIIGAEEFANKCDFSLVDGIFFAKCYLRDRDGNVHLLERSVDLTPAIDFVVKRLTAWHTQQHGAESAAENLPNIMNSAVAAVQRVAQNKTVHSLLSQAQPMLTEDRESVLGMANTAANIYCQAMNGSGEAMAQMQELRNLADDGDPDAQFQIRVMQNLEVTLRKKRQRGLGAYQQGLMPPVPASLARTILPGYANNGPLSTTDRPTPEYGPPLEEYVDDEFFDGGVGPYHEHLEIGRRY